MNNYHNLINFIKNLSVSKNWDISKLEWKLEEIYENEEFSTCVCGHYPIKEICVIKNNLNYNSAEVGNCCVKNFLGIPSDKLFSSMKKLRKDISSSVNSYTLTLSYKTKNINEWEYEFYSSLIRKRNLSEKQYSKKVDINKKIMKGVLSRKGELQ